MQTICVYFLQKFPVCFHRSHNLGVKSKYVKGCHVKFNFVGPVSHKGLKWIQTLQLQQTTAPILRALNQISKNKISHQNWRKTSRNQNCGVYGTNKCQKTQQTLLNICALLLTCFVVFRPNSLQGIRASSYFLVVPCLNSGGGVCHDMVSS